jgi:phosphoribosylformylglycinamidine cyclo-ligase
VERKHLLTGEDIVEGDVLIGLPSSGLHTNGYSLARKLLFEVAGFRVDSNIPELGTTAAEELLKVHRSYLKPLKSLIRLGLLKGAAHITGGGVTENTPRMLASGLAAEIQTQSWPVPAIFELLRKIGNVPEDDYRRTFNLGIGMIVAVAEKQAAKAEKALRRAGETPYRIGRVVKSPKGKGGRVVYK